MLLVEEHEHEQVEGRVLAPGLSSGSSCAIDANQSRLRPFRAAACASQSAAQCPVLCFGAVGRCSRRLRIGDAAVSPLERDIPGVEGVALRVAAPHLRPGGGPRGRVGGQGTCLSWRLSFLAGKENFT